MERGTRSETARTPKEDASFAEELEKIRPTLLRFARKLTGGKDTSEELVAETILKAYKARRQFTPGTSLNAWTYQILRNTFLTEIRKQEVRNKHASTVLSLHEAMPIITDQEKGLELKETLEHMEKLPIDYRNALIEVAFNGLNYEEAAQLFGVPEGTVKSRVSRARALLKKMSEE